MRLEERRQLGGNDLIRSSTQEMLVIMDQLPPSKQSDIENKISDSISRLKLKSAEEVSTLWHSLQAPQVVGAALNGTRNARASDITREFFQCH